MLISVCLQKEAIIESEGQTHLFLIKPHQIIWWLTTLVRDSHVGWKCRVKRFDNDRERTELEDLRATGLMQSRQSLRHQTSRAFIPPHLSSHKHHLPSAFEYCCLTPLPPVNASATALLSFSFSVWLSEWLVSSVRSASYISLIW